MSKTIKEAVMEYFNLDLVPHSLMDEIEAIMSDQVIHPLVPEVGYGSTEEIREQNLGLAKALNKRSLRQRQALKTALYGKASDEGGE